MSMILFKLFLFWRIGLFLVTYLGSMVFPLVANGGIGAVSSLQQFDFWKSWAQWDGGHYFQIAQNGYLSPADFVFFPLFPATVKIFSYLFWNNYLLSGLIISNLAFMLFLLVFARFVEIKYSKKISFSSTVTFLVFPTTFFAVAFYSESFFLLLSALTFLLISREKYLLASVITSLASLTRFIGIFLVISIAYNYFAKIKFKINKIYANLYSTKKWKKKDKLKNK